MSNKQPAWNVDREEELKAIVGNESPVSLETVAKASEAMGNSTRSIASKLRKMDFVVEKVSEKAKSFSDKEEEALVAFVNGNPGTYTFKEIASQVMGSEDFAKKVQGKLLSLELTDKVKKAEVKETVKKYTEDEEKIIEEMANNDSFLEDIAKKLGKDIKSVRGKCLSMLKSHGIKYPTQKNKVTATDVLDGLTDIGAMTVKAIAEAVGKTEKGIKTILTHRGIDCDDYKGATRAAKIAEKKAA